MKTSLGHYMKAKNVLKTYYFEPSYIEKDGHLRLFQAQMIDFYNDIENPIAITLFLKLSPNIAVLAPYLLVPVIAINPSKSIS